MSHSEVQNHRKGFEVFIYKIAQTAERAQAKLKKKNKDKESAFAF